MRTRVRLFWFSVPALALAWLAGCSSLDKKEPVEEPAKLSSLGRDSIPTRRVWSASLGKLPKKDYSGLQPAFEGKAMYAASSEGEVWALDAATGRKLWSATVKQRLISGPTVIGSFLALGTLDGEVIALKRENGDTLWRTAVSSEVLAAPAGNDEVVVARAGDGWLFGLAAGDGQRLWSFERAAPTLTLRGVSRPLVSDGRVYVGLDTGKVAALALDSGNLLWEQTVGQPGGRSEVERLVDVDADLVLSGNTLYAVSYAGQLMALDASSGEILWKHELASYSGFVLEGDRLYASDREGRVTALDPANGDVIWHQDALKFRRLTRPAVQNGNVVVGDLEGYVHWLSTKDGALIGRMKISSDPLTLAPQVVGNRLYVRDHDGGISAIDLPQPRG
jgi:outer membrane protein assembly factor BamB